MDENLKEKETEKEQEVEKKEEQPETEHKENNEEKQEENKEQKTENNAEEESSESVENKEEKEDSEVKEEEQKEEVKEEKTENNTEEEKPSELEKKKEKLQDKTPFKIAKIIWKVLKIILVLIMILVFFVIAVQRLSNNKITVGGYGVYTIVSESMVPEYNLWDMLLAKKTDLGEIAVGDDVVYQGKEGDFAGKIVTHRVIKRGFDGKQYHFITKGIANPIEDPRIYGDQIYGKVIFKSSILSTLSKVLNNSYGFYFIVFVPIVIIVTLEIIDTVNERKKLKEEE